MQYGASERVKEKTARKRKTKGCFDFESKDYRLENIRYNNCIGNHAVSIDFIMDAFLFYEKGVLPFEGTLGEHPNKIVDIFDVIHRRRAENIKKNEPKK